MMHGQKNIKLYNASLSLSLSQRLSLCLSLQYVAYFHLQLLPS